MQPEQGLDLSEGAKAERLGGVLVVFASLLWPLQAALIAWVLADLLADTKSPYSLICVVFLGLSAARSLLNAISLKLLSGAADAKIASVRERVIIQEAATLHPSEFGGAGAIAALVTDKTEALRPFLMRYRPARLRVMVMPLLILSICVWYSWAVAVVLLVAGPLIPVFMALVGWAAKNASERQMSEIGSLTDMLADRLAALSDFRLLGAGTQIVSSFSDAADRLRLQTMAVLRIAFLSSTVLELFAALGVAMIAVWVGFSLLGELSWGTWGAPLSPFAGIFMLLLAPDFFQPLRDLASAWHDKHAADAVKSDLVKWAETDRPAITGRGVFASPKIFGTLETQHLTVSRNRQALLLPNIRIEAGESVALTGASGAGKTTLLRLLAGLQRPTTGEILIDGEILDDTNADSWRASLGWMPQSPRFLARSLRHNIGFGKALRPAILTEAKVLPILSNLPDGQATLLGESGAGISGGEARRVMLARALHQEPRIILADEPTADLDSETAQAIMQTLLRFVAKGGTLVAATHDPRLISQLDRQITFGAAP